jgi:hypothetical protein
MDKLPYDIVLLIFEVYVHDFRRSPTSLLSVCQKWKQFLLASPTLWTRVAIFVDSIHCVPKMLESKMYGLEAYLSRSEGSDRQFPLDIDLNWQDLKNREEDHELACGSSLSEGPICEEMPCKLAVLLRAQLYQVFTVLFGIYSDGNASQRRLKRWTTLRADLSGILHREWTRSIVTLLPPQEEIVTLSLPSLHTAVLRNFWTYYPSIDLPGLRRLELWDMSALVNSLSISDTKYLRFGGFIPNALRTEFPWQSCQVEVLELDGFGDDIVNIENSLPSLTTLILNCNDRVYVNWNDLARRFDAARPLHTIVLLGISIRNVYSVPHWVPWLEIQNWKLTCECYKRSPTDLVPSYSTKEICCEMNKSKLEAARDLLALIQERGLQVESLDTCTTHLFEVALREIRAEFKDAV